MPRFRREYSESDRDVALAFLRRIAGTTAVDKSPREIPTALFRKAAKRADVEEAALRFWAYGGAQLSAPEDDGDAEPASPLVRPRPPELLLDPEAPGWGFAPAPDLIDWSRAMFLEEGAPYFNEDHWHLADAKILALWTNVPNVKQGKQTVGMAELVGSRGNKWQTGRDLYQLERWYGGKEIPDFVVTFDALFCAEASAATFCALVEHELYHCGLKLDEWGAPRYDPDGNLIYAVRPHDFEGFLGVTRRWGVHHAEQGVAELVAAAKVRPVFDEEDVEADVAAVTAGCGTCH